MRRYKSAYISPKPYSYALYSNVIVNHQDELAAVYISVAATDDSSLQTIYAHATYHADDILWNHRFAQSCVEMDHLQTLCFDKFQLVAPLPGGSDDDSRSNGSRHSSMSNLTAADAPARHAEAAYTARDRLEHVRTHGQRLRCIGCGGAFGVAAAVKGRGGGPYCPRLPSIRAHLPCLGFAVVVCSCGKENHIAWNMRAHRAFVQAVGGVALHLL